MAWAILSAKMILFSGSALPGIELSAKRVTNHAINAMRQDLLLVKESCILRIELNIGFIQRSIFQPHLINGEHIDVGG